MLPSCALVLFFFSLFMLCFPLCKLPLSLLALEKRPYLLEKPGQALNRNALIILSQRESGKRCIHPPRFFASCKFEKVLYNQEGRMLFLGRWML